MKSILRITGLLSIVLLSVSCSNDDYEMPEVKNNNLKIIPKDLLKKEVNGSVIDSTTINTYDDGEPNNPKPPRS